MPDPTQNLALQELVRRELARRKLKYYIPYVFPGYRPNAANQLICDSCDLIVNGTITRLMVFIQPRFGKSEIVSRKLPGFYLGRYPDNEIILTSYAESLATTFSREARDTVRTDLYQNLFGTNSVLDEKDYAVQVSDTTKAIENWRLKGRKGGVFAKGVGGGITGQGAHLGIIDDPISDDTEAQSEKIREDMYAWYFSAFRSRLSDPKTCGIILCMTRWHEDDLAGHLLRTQYDIGELWYVLRLPALAETPEQTRDWCARNYVAPDRLLTPARVAQLAGE